MLSRQFKGDLLIHSINAVVMLRFWGFLFEKHFKVIQVCLQFPIQWSFCAKSFSEVFLFVESQVADCQIPLKSWTKNTKEDWQLSPFVNCTLFPSLVRCDQAQDVSIILKLQLQSFTRIKLAKSFCWIFCPFLMMWKILVAIETSKNIINWFHVWEITCIWKFHCLVGGEQKKWKILFMKVGKGTSRLMFVELKS